MNKKEIRSSIRAILKDKTSGSTFLADQIEKIFSFIPEDMFLPTIKKLINTHSSMASVINRINYLCLEKEGKKFIRKKVFEKKIFRNFWSEHQAKKNWITLSMSYWIIECFRYNKNKINLKLGISYPDKEGLITFDSLKNFHNIEIYDDSRLCFEVQQTDGILLGADLITKNMVVNKIGSFSLAIAAKYFKKPLYVMSSGEKFLSKDIFPLFQIKSKKKKARVINYFEPLPIELIKKIYLTSSLWDYPLSDTLRSLM